MNWPYFFESDSSARNFSEYLLSDNFPYLLFKVFVVSFDVLLNKDHEIYHKVKDAAPQYFICQFSETAFYEIEPLL